MNKENSEDKMNTKDKREKLIILIYEFNVAITLTARKNIMKVQKFKKLIMFRMIFEKSKKILKLNDIQVKNVVTTAIFRRKKFKIMMHKIKVKSISQNISANIIKKSTSLYIRNYK